MPSPMYRGNTGYLPQRLVRRPALYLGSSEAYCTGECGNPADCEQFTAIAAAIA